MSQHLVSLFSYELGVGQIRSSWQSGKFGDVDSVFALASKTLLLAMAAAALRRALPWLKSRIDNDLFPTAYISPGDAAYLWVMAWISQDPAAQAQIKNFQLQTSESRQARRDDKDRLHARGPLSHRHMSVRDFAAHNASWDSGEIIGQILPTYRQKIRIKHGHNYLWVTRRSRSATSEMADHMQIETFLWQRNALRDFLSAAHYRFHAKSEHELLIFHSENTRVSSSSWQKPIYRPVRPWSSVILPDTVKEDFLTDVTRFMSDKEIAWYAERGIPHRRGYLFHGAPGAGKTTLATAIASKLGLNIYVISPAQRGMDDPSLNKLFRDCPARSLILIEDIDCVFPPKKHPVTVLDDVETDSDDVEGSSTARDPLVRTIEASPSSRPKPRSDTTLVTLSGLLNAIDGVSSQEGCILIASTNHPEDLDAALRRPGRFDVQIPFFNATHDQARALFEHFYPISAFPTGDPESSATPVDQLATDFADAVFPRSVGADGAPVRRKRRQVSMAALQGFLLGYKDDPAAALQAAAAWARAQPRNMGRMVRAVEKTEEVVGAEASKVLGVGKKKKREVGVEASMAEGGDGGKAPDA